MKAAAACMMLLFAGASDALAKPRPAARAVFTCAVGNGHVARVIAQGTRLTYRYGTRRRTELEIVGGPGAGNVFHMYQRYAGPQEQLRFTRGEYSYILHSMDANTMSQSNAVSGLAVLRGTRRISDRACKPWAYFDWGWEDAATLRGRLQEDDESFSAM